MEMDQKERAKKDLDKLERILSIFRSLDLDKKYPKVMEYAENYSKDASIVRTRAIISLPSARPTTHTDS